MSKKETLIVPDGSQIYYEVVGHGPALMLLHGNGGSGRYFKKQIAAFSKYFTLLIVDSRGHGHSTNTQAKLSFQLMAADLRAILEHEAIQTVNLLGFSDGANLALVYALRYPEQVNKLILNAGNTTVAGVRFIHRIASYLEYFGVKLLAPFSHTMRAFLPVARLLIEDLGVSEKELQTLRVPTLVIVGKHDMIKLSHSLFLSQTIPEASFILVPKQGHRLAQTDPTTFNQIVLSFLGEEPLHEKNHNLD